MSKIWTILDKILDKLFVEDFYSKITVAPGESIPHKQFIKQGNLITIVYQGEAKTHSSNAWLFTLPEAYRPKEQTFSPFTKNGIAYGEIVIDPSDGGCKVNQISSTSASGRIYFSLSYYI